jgi:DNA anti-recombination protein RmuC
MNDLIHKNKQMKNRFLIMTILGCIATVGIASCVKTHEKKVETAEINVMEARQDLQQARIDSTEYMKYKADAEVKLKENKSKISELKATMNTEGKETQTQYAKMINELDQKNSEMEHRIKEFNSDSKENWETFKFDFNKQMDELGKSISETAEKNMKKNK